MILWSPNVYRMLKPRQGLQVLWLWWRCTEKFAMSIAAQLFVPMNMNAICVQWQITRPFYSVHYTVTKITKVLLAMCPYFLFWFFNYVIYLAQAYWKFLCFSQVMYEWWDQSLRSPGPDVMLSTLGPCGPILYLISRDLCVGCFILGSWLLF